MGIRGKEGRGVFRMGMSGAGALWVAAASDCKDMIGSFLVLLNEEGSSCCEVCDARSNE